MKLSEVWDEVIFWIKEYLKACRKEKQKPDYNLIRKEAKRMARRLYQRSSSFLGEKSARVFKVWKIL